jgi:hypothetical protein
MENWSKRIWVDGKVVHTVWSAPVRKWHVCTTCRGAGGTTGPMQPSMEWTWIACPSCYGSGGQMV